MDYFKPFEAEMEHVFTEAKHIIASFPEPFDQAGLSYLKKFNPLEPGSSKNYICYLLPYWIQDISLHTNEHSRQLSLANVFNMLYFFVQDDLMDSAPMNWKDQLALGNLFYLELNRILRRHFSYESPFWNYWDKYVQEWTIAVTNESEQDYYHTNPIMVAKKASPLKLASTGALLLSNQPHLIAQMEEFVDYVLVSLQLCDDLADWEEDLEEGSYNCLLALIKKQYNTELSKKNIENAIFLHDCLIPYSSTAFKHLQLTQELWPNQAKFLHSFHHSMASQLQNKAQSLQDNRRLLRTGGFNYFLSSTVSYP